MGLASAFSCRADDAKQHLQQGEAYEKTREMDKAIAEFKAAIELDPNLAEAHSKFILATQMSYLEKTGFEKANNFEERRKLMDGAFATANGKLRVIYEGWAQEHPERAVYQWALGTLWREEVEKDERITNESAGTRSQVRASGKRLGKS